MSLDRPWIDRAACIDTPVDVFFPPDDPIRAKQVCRTCPVSGQCLRYAVEAGETQGIWGGLTPRERSSWARRQGIARHGTLTGYTTDGCRCGPCCEVATDYAAQRRGFTRREGLAPCGTSAAYRRHLRNDERPCDACREASAARKRGVA